VLGLVDFIVQNYKGKVVEIASGSFFKVALELHKRGLEVLCTDIRRIKAPKEIKFYQDDVRDPNIQIYAKASLIYSIRPPHELFHPIHSLSKRIGADCIIKPLHDEIPEGFELVNHGGDYFYISRRQNVSKKDY
jgi:hypothetical protein